MTDGPAERGCLAERAAQILLFERRPGRGSQKWMLAEGAKNGGGAKMDAVEGTRSGCSSLNWMPCISKD